MVSFRRAAGRPPESSAAVSSDSAPQTGLTDLVCWGIGYLLRPSSEHPQGHDHWLPCFPTLSPRQGSQVIGRLTLDTLLGANQALLLPGQPAQTRPCRSQQASAYPSVPPGHGVGSGPWSGDGGVVGVRGRGQAGPGPPTAPTPRRAVGPKHQEGRKFTAAAGRAQWPPGGGRGPGPEPGRAERAGRGRGVAVARGSRDRAPRPEPPRSCSPRQCSSPPGEPDPRCPAPRLGPRRLRVRANEPDAPQSAEQAEAFRPVGPRPGLASTLAGRLESPPPRRQAGEVGALSVPVLQMGKTEALKRVTNSLRTQWKAGIGWSRRRAERGFPLPFADVSSPLFSRKI